MAKKNIQSRKVEKKRYQIEVTFLTLFLLGFCTLFFMAWIFVLGIFVGRGFLPGADSGIMDLKNQVVKLQEIMARNKRVEPEPNKKENIDEKLGFYEKLESRKAERARNDPEPLKKEKEEKAEPPKPVREEIKTAPPAGKGGYTLQLASLEEKEKAETMVRSLASKGYEVYYYEVLVKGKTYYRVRCGRFMNKEEAGAWASKLLKEEKIRGFVSKID